MIAKDIINSISISPAGNDWIATSRHPRVLHIFEHVCNLINEHGEILSIVTPVIGNGPFHLVVESGVCFSDHLHLESRIFPRRAQLTLGDLTIHTAVADLWNPRPDWEKLRANREMIAAQIIKPLAMGHPFPLPQSLISSLASALAAEDVPSARASTSRLAGLGIGLTPSGDDVIMGALYAAWIIHPAEVASVLASEMASIAVPLTTSLSAAWVRAAGKGEAGILWHEFLDALISANPQQFHIAMKNILAVGETSGADALAGFLATWQAWRKANAV